MAFYEYAIASGFNVALLSLTNVETLLGYPPNVQPVDPYPVRQITLSNRVIGSGTPVVIWTFRDAVPITVVKTIEDTFFSNGVDLWANVTINTRRHNRSDYERYNAIASLPQPQVNYTYDRRFAFNLTWEFRIIGDAT